AVLGGQRIEVDVCAEMVEIGFPRSFFIVVVALAIGQLCMPYGQVENACLAAALTWRGLGKVALAVTINLQMHNRMLNKKFAQVDLATQCGLNLQADGELVATKQWRVIVILAASNHDVVKVSGEGGKIEGEPANLRSTTGRFIRRYNNLPDGILLKGAAL